jgi:hypothetical protein
VSCTEFVGRLSSRFEELRSALSTIDAIYRSQGGCYATVVSELHLAIKTDDRFLDRLKSELPWLVPPVQNLPPIVLPDFPNYPEAVQRQLVFSCQFDSSAFADLATWTQTLVAMRRIPRSTTPNILSVFHGYTAIFDGQSPESDLQSRLLSQIDACTFPDLPESDDDRLNRVIGTEREAFDQLKDGMKSSVSAGFEKWSRFKRDTEVTLRDWLSEADGLAIGF